MNGGRVRLVASFSAVERLLLLAIVASSLILVGCDLSQPSRLDLTNGASVDAGEIGVRNILVVADDSGQGTVLASLVNSGDVDQLLAVVVDGVEVPLPGGPLDLLPQRLVSIGPDATRVDVTNLQRRPGQNVEIMFQFAGGPRASVSNALVRPDTGIYDDALAPPP